METRRASQLAAWPAALTERTSDVAMLLSSPSPRQAPPARCAGRLRASTCGSAAPRRARGLRVRAGAEGADDYYDAPSPAPASLLPTPPPLLAAPPPPPPPALDGPSLHAGPQLPAFLRGLSAEDALTTAGFTLALLLLVVVTLGVAYLTYLDFADRQESQKDAERTAREASASAFAAQARQQPGAPRPEAPRPPPGAGDPALQAAKKKGFGAQAVQAPKADAPAAKAL